MSYTETQLLFLDVKPGSMLDRTMYDVTLKYFIYPGRTTVEAVLGPKSYVNVMFLGESNYYTPSHHKDMKSEEKRGNLYACKLADTGIHLYIGEHHEK